MVLRQCLLLTPLLNPSPERSLYLPGSLDPLLPYQPPMPPHFSRRPNIFSPVSVGTPQGSPISPLLFIIYVSSLHLSIPKGIIFSYVDDFTVTVSSLSYRRNTQRLQHYYSTLKRRANSLGVSFSIPKTELCHRRTTRDRAPISSAPVCLDGSLFHPSSLVRWLGY